MGNEIGLLIKNLRSKKNISQETLANRTFISRSALSMIEIGQRQAPEDFLILASNILEFDFLNYIQKSSNFNKIEHFTLSYKLLNAVQSNDINSIEELLEHDTVKTEFTYGEPLGVKTTCTALLLNRRGDYKTVIDICYEFFNINDITIKTFKPKVNMPTYYYSLIINLTFSLKKVGNIDNAFIIERAMVDFLENTYFNAHLPFTSIDYFYHKQYVLSLNNLADSYFICKNYDMALEICNKAIIQSKRLGVLGLLDALLELKTEILYCIFDYLGSKATFLQFKAICEVTDYLDYYSKIEEKFKILYPLLFE